MFFGRTLKDMHVSDACHRPNHACSLAAKFSFVSTNAQRPLPDSCVPPTNPLRQDQIPGPAQNCRRRFRGPARARAQKVILRLPSVVLKGERRLPAQLGSPNVDRPRELSKGDHYNLSCVSKQNCHILKRRSRSESAMTMLSGGRTC